MAVLIKFAKFLLCSFAISLGAVLALFLVIRGYERHANMARDMREWSAKSLIGYRTTLKTELMNQTVQYEFTVQPADPKLVGNFRAALESVGESNRSFGITLLDKSGFPLCSATVKESDFLRTVDQAGNVKEWEATGILHRPANDYQYCSANDYRQAAEWSPETTFPRLSMAKPSSPPVPIPSKRPKHVSAAWRNRANWRKLQLGMTQAEVKALLGPPGSVDNTFGLDWWLYPDILGGRVEFSPDGKVTGWSEPSR